MPMAHGQETAELLKIFLILKTILLDARTRWMPSPLNIMASLIQNIFMNTIV